MSDTARSGAWRTMVRRGGIVLALTTLAMLLAACNQVGTNQVTFWDIVWSMVIFFFMIMYLMIFFSIIMDIFRRNDLSGGWKVVWLLAVFIFPFLGLIVYMITRPKMTAQDLQMAVQAEAAQKAAAAVSPADELKKLQALKEAGVISQAEYDSLKAKIIA